MATVTVSRSGDRLIAVKQVPAGHARDIEQEAETLRRLDHPGVVRFVDAIETPDHGRALHTEFVSSDTWATRPITDPTQRAEGVAAVAEVVADLHDMGIAHCQINPSHVLHGDGDRPVLCGFRLSTEATPENRRGDLVAIADLCHDPALEQGPLVEKLSTLADAARAGRLGVRELSRRIGLLMNKRPAATEPAQAARDSSGRSRPERSRRRSLAVAATVLAAVAAALAAGLWSRDGRGSTPPVTITDGAAPPTAAADIGTSAAAAPESVGEPDSPAADPAPATPEERTATAIEASAPAATPASVSRGATDPATAGAYPTTAANTPSSMIPGVETGPGLTGTTSGGALTSAATGSLLAPAAPAGPSWHESGAILEHGGQLYGVGAPGDFVDTGDWDCDGRPTPAIIRPSTGHIVLFDAWPAPDQTISMPVRWEVDTPTGAETVAHGSCDLLRVYTPAGSTLLDPMEGQ